MAWDRLLPLLALLPAIGVFLDGQHWTDAEDRRPVQQFLGELHAWLASDATRPRPRSWWRALKDLLGRGLLWMLAGLAIFWAAAWLETSSSLGGAVSLTSDAVTGQVGLAFAYPQRDLTLRWLTEIHKGAPAPLEVPTTRADLMAVPRISREEEEKRATLQYLWTPDFRASVNAARRSEARDIAQHNDVIGLAVPWRPAIMWHWLGILVFAMSAGVYAIGALMALTAVGSMALLPLGFLFVLVVRPVLAAVFGASSHPKRKPFIYLTSLAALIIAIAKAVTHAITGS